MLLTDLSFPVSIFTALQIQLYLFSLDTSFLGSLFLVLFSSIKIINDSLFLPEFYLSCQVKKDVSLFCIIINGRSRASGQKLWEGLFKVIKGNHSKQELLYNKTACSSIELPAPGEMYNQELGTTCQGCFKKYLCIMIKENTGDIENEDS